MDDLNPITRTERLLDGEDLTPTNREEMFIRRIYDKTQEIPEPVNRKEYFLKKAGEAGGDVTVVPLSVTDNGTYSEAGKAYSPVTVEVEPPEDSYQLKSITTPTPLATFNASAMPMPSLKVSVEAKQASGTPSPSNPLPISGWDEANVSDVGKNLIPNTGYTQGLLGWNEDNTEAIQTSGNYITSPYIKVNPNTKYAIHTYVGAIVRLYITDKNHNKLYWKGNHPITGETEILEIPSNGYYVRFSIGIDGQIVTPSGYGTLVYAQLEVGETATTYEPYINQTTTITLGQTVYGGELDVVNGELKITDGYISSYNGETLPSTWISSMDVYAEGTTPTTGAEVCYELATPTTVSITPTLIKSLNGTNNLSVDCGEIIEGEYFIALGGNDET